MTQIRNSVPNFTSPILLCDGADVKGDIWVLNKLAVDSGWSKISNDEITIGFTNIRRDRAVVNEAHSNEFTARAMEVRKYMRSDNVASERVQVTQQVFPDFVFNKDFDLQTIDELDKYIKQHGHLPGIPTEEEVKEKGLDLGEMSTQLLQKIEEMTLYIIQLEKRVEKLKKSE